MKVGDRVRLRDPKLVKQTIEFVYPGAEYVIPHINNIYKIKQVKSVGEAPYYTKRITYYLEEIPSVYWLEEWLEPVATEDPYCTVCGGWWTHRLQCKKAA